MLGGGNALIRLESQTPAAVARPARCRPSDPLTAVCPLQVKSDEHMAKVKEQLLYEKQQIEATDQR